jgi:hypothetical protein
MIFFEIKSILRHRREVFVASPVSIEFQVNARLLRSLITSKLRKKSTIMRADSDDFVCVCVSWRISRRDQITADLIKTRPRKCNVFHHLGVPRAVTPKQADTDAA